MSSPYGPSGGQQDPQQWGQQQPYGQPPGPPSGGFPAQGYPQQQPQQGYPGYGQQQPYGDPNQQQPQYGDPSQQQYGYGQQSQQPGYPGYGGQQPQQFGQYQQYPGLPPQEKKGGGAWIWVLVAAVVVIAGAVAVLGFITPGWFTKKVFEVSAMQDGVKMILTDKYRIEGVESVSCPADQEVKKDNQFPCEVVIGGEKKTVTITVRNTNGEYEVAPPADR